MGSSSELAIKIGLETGTVKSNLDKVQADFVAASAGINKALGAIHGFADLKKQTEETSKAYGEAQKKVAALAKEVKSGVGGAALAKEFEQAKASAGKLKETLIGQQQQLQQVRSAMTATGVSTSGLAGQQAALRSQLELTRQKYQELAKVASARDTLKLTPHVDITADINKAKAAYATLTASGKLSMAELAQAKVALRGRIEELTARTNGWRDAMGGVRSGMFEVAAAAAPMVLAIGQAIKFESSMAGVKKVVETTPVGFQALRKEIVGLSREIPLSINELAQIAAAGGQLGIATEDIGAFVKVSAKMAIAFDMTAQAAGDSIGQLKNVYQLAVGEVEGLGDAINYLGNKSAAKEKAIIEVMLRVGGTSRQFGLAKEQTAALASAFISLGKAPEVASTSINAMLNRMQTATMQSGDFMAALDKIGMSAEGMAAQVAANPQQALNTLLETLSKLSGQERAEVLTGLFGREFQDDIGVLVGSLQTYRDSLALVSDQTKYAGSMNKEFEERTKTTEYQIQLMKNSVVEAGQALGTTFLPAIKAILAPITGLIRLLADAAVEAPKLTASLATIGTGALVFHQVSKLALIARLAIAGMGTQSLATAPVVVNMFRLIATGAITLATINPALTLLAAALGVGAVAWKVFGGDALESSKKHAKAAAELDKVASGIRKEVVELESLQKTLLGTAEGAEAHVAAEEKLAVILPDTTKKLDDQGRILAVVKDATSENNKALQEHINLKKADLKIQTGLQLEQQAKAYFKAAESVKQYKSDLQQWYGIGEKTTSVTQDIWLSINRLTGTYDENIKKGSEMRENLSKQKSEFESLLQSLAKSGATAEEVGDLLSGIKIDEGTKAQIVAEYKAMFAAINTEAVSSATAQQAATQQTAAVMKQASGAALDEMKKQYQDYVNQVRQLQEQITDRQRSLYAELRDLARSGMSGVDAWYDQKKAAKEYETAARKAMEAATSAFAAGDTIKAGEKYKEAVAYADEAKNAYKALNTEVKNGDEVIVSKQKGLSEALRGVESAGNLSIEVLKRQSEAARGAMEALSEKSGFVDLTEGMNAAERAWLKNWDTMRAYADEQIVHVEQKMEALTKDRWATVWITEKGAETVKGTYQQGGAIQALAAGGGVRNILGGGHLPGFGGGDRRLVLAEDGEVMINKHATRAAGLKAALAFNAGRFDVVIAELVKRTRAATGYRLGGLIGSLPEVNVQRLATGGQVSAPSSSAQPSKVVELRFAGGQVHGDESSVETLLRHLENAGLSA